MRNIVLVFLMLTGFFVQAQVFKGKEDIKFQVGAIFQEHANGITSTTDFGLGKNMSAGFQGTYLLKVDNFESDKAKFEDRIDIRGRFSAHIAEIFDIEEKIDIHREKVTCLACICNDVKVVVTFSLLWKKVRHLREKVTQLSFCLEGESDTADI